MSCPTSTLWLLPNSTMPCLLCLKCSAFFSALVLGGASDVAISTVPCVGAVRCSTGHHACPVLIRDRGVSEDAPALLGRKANAPRAASVTMAIARVSETRERRRFRPVELLVVVTNGDIFLSFECKNHLAQGV